MGICKISVFISQVSVSVVCHSDDDAVSGADVIQLFSVRQITAFGYTVGADSAWYVFDISGFHYV